MPVIPQPILDLLRKEHLSGSDLFHGTIEEDTDRIRAPRFYPIADNDPVYAEALHALRSDDFFGKFIHSTNAGLVVNEHVEHVLRDFLSEVYEAWEAHYRTLVDLPSIPPKPPE